MRKNTQIFSPENLNQNEVRTQVTDEIPNIESNIKKNIEETATYQKWTFYIMLIIFILTITGIFYIQIKGLPVKIKP